MALRLTIYMQKKKQVWNPDWDKKRTIIKASLNEKEKGLILKKFGSLPNSRTIKQVLLNNSVLVEKKIKDDSKEEIIFQLKKIGNNLNQIAFKVNSNDLVDPKRIEFAIQELFNYLKKLDEN